MNRRSAIVRALAAAGVVLTGCGDGTPETVTQDIAPGKLRYAVIGDSYSNGEGVGLESSWPEQLKAALAGELEIEIVANPSVTGWTSQMALERELPEIRKSRPDVVTVLLGVNDFVQGVPQDRFARNLREILGAAIDLTGRADAVVAVTIPDFSTVPAAQSFGDPAQISAGVAAFNEVVKAEARTAGVPVADIYPVSQEPGVGLVSPDGLHPSAKELARWTTVIEPVARRAWRNVG